ncbi:ribosome maturation factor RimM [Natronospirillum operosum]|uniref:Ribosome maturation factor RimM n=1 Tax=Natronospirillum operosum TaxID=2759953 RepID=A0A4Z0WFR0_9GAMM|nr:ribosome maturation factor RimM [Natronospirillum operosum]TGG95870.1 ribosome maturation factor RimM [Natronospirillum operosum]
MTAQPSELITLGKITSVYGVRGWVKVYSYTDPMDRILDYQEWLLSRNGEQMKVVVDRGKSHGKGMIAHLQGVDDRNAAEALAGYEIAVPRSELPELPEGEYYWWQLEGMQVYTLKGVDLGRVSHLISAGSANDVLVVHSTRADDNQSERLIPWIWDEVIQAVDPDARRITVDWDPDF